jgi:hypothetical protein
MKTIEPPESPNRGRRLRSGQKGEKKGGQIAVSGFLRAVAQMADVAWVWLLLDPSTLLSN